MSDGQIIPAKFWQTTPEAEMWEICRRGTLNSAQCQRLWQMMDYQGEPPRELLVLVERASVEKRWPRRK